MADTAVATPVSAGTPKKTKAGAGAKKAVKKPTHPPTSEMVNKAIADLKERGGSSLQAIKKYIAANYKVDADRVAPFVRKYLKAAVEKGALVRTKGKGKGATGSFKLEGKSKPTVAKESAPKAKKTGVKTGRVAKKKPVAKKAAAPKKAKAATTKKAKPAAAPKKATTPKPKKTPTKAKKTAKPPTKKPKTPKPKKTTAGASKGRPAATKKASAKK